MLAAFKREFTDEWTAAILHHQRGNGERTVGNPFGWADEGGRLVAVPEEQIYPERIAVLTPSPNPDPGLMSESSCPA